MRPMSEFDRSGRIRAITLIILSLMAIGMGYDRLKENEKKSAPIIPPAHVE